jgi:hypothetical protein
VKKPTFPKPKFYREKTHIPKTQILSWKKTIPNPKFYLEKNIFTNRAIVPQAIYDMLGAGATKPTDSAEERAKVSISPIHPPFINSDIVRTNF